MTEVERPRQSQEVDEVADTVAAPPLGAASRAISGEEFRRLYDAHFRYVWHSLRRLGVFDRDLEDLCHDVFVVLYRGFGRVADGYDPSRPLRPWLFGVAFRLASDYRRRMSHRLEVPAEPSAHDRADGAESPHELVERRETRARVQRALDSVELARRAVLVMHDLDGHPMPEIAAALGVPLNTCYSRLRLARADFTAAVRRLAARDQRERHE